MWMLLGTTIVWAGSLVAGPVVTRCQALSWAALGPTSRSVLDVPVRAGRPSLRERSPSRASAFPPGAGPGRG